MSRTITITIFLSIISLISLTILAFFSSVEEIKYLSSRNYQQQQNTIRPEYQRNLDKKRDQMNKPSTYPQNKKYDNKKPLYDNPRPQKKYEYNSTPQQTMPSYDFNLT